MRAGFGKQMECIASIFGTSILKRRMFSEWIGFYNDAIPSLPEKNRKPFPIIPLTHRSCSVGIIRSFCVNITLVVRMIFFRWLSNGYHLRWMEELPQSDNRKLIFRNHPPLGKTKILNLDSRRATKFPYGTA